MKNQQIITLGIILIVVLGAFYWFAYRPYSAKQTCYREVVSDSVSYANKSPEYINRAYAYWSPLYTACLKKYGL